MCIEDVIYPGVEDLKSNRPMYGYKVFNVNPATGKPEFEFTSEIQGLKRRCWMTAIVDKCSALPYPTGFHIFLEYEDTVHWAYAKQVIYKVLYKEPCAFGIYNGDYQVVVARKMFVLKDVTPSTAEVLVILAKRGETKMKKSVYKCLSLIDQGASVGVAVQLLLQIEQSPAAALTEMIQILTKKAHASGYTQAVRDAEELLTKKGN